MLVLSNIFVSENIDDDDNNFNNVYSSSSSRSNRTG